MSRKTDSTTARLARRATTRSQAPTRAGRAAHTRASPTSTPRKRASPNSTSASAAETATQRHPTVSPSSRAPEADRAEPRPLGRVLSARQFWDLMQRWRVSDQAALLLIGYPGNIGRASKRPRFRFSTRQQRLSAYLPEIDAALPAAGKDYAWLHRTVAREPFAGRSPVRLISETGAAGAAAVLRMLQLLALRRSLAAGRT